MSYKIIYNILGIKYKNRKSYNIILEITAVPDIFCLRNHYIIKSENPLFKSNKT